MASRGSAKCCRTNPRDIYVKLILDSLSGEELANGTLTLLRINGESHQKCIRISIAKRPGDVYANF